MQLQVIIPTFLFVLVWLGALGVTSTYFWRNRHIRYIRTRSVWLMLVSHWYGWLTSLLMIIGLITDSLYCLLIGILYSWLLPFVFGPMVMMVPELVIRYILNLEKENRAQGIISNWWQFQILTYTWFKILIIVCFGIIQTSIYVTLYFTVETNNLGNCQRLPLFVFDGTMILIFIPFGFLVRKINQITDPYHIKTQIIGTFVVTVPLTIVTIIWPFAPQIFGTGFDFRIIYIISNAIMFICNLPCVVLYHYFHNDGCSVMTEIRASRSNLTINLGLDDMDYQSLLDFARKTWCTENILFHRAVLAFENEGPRTVENAKKIADEFIGESAPMEVNLVAETVQRIQDDIQTGAIDSMLFSTAKMEVEHIIRTDILTRWMTAREV